MEASNADPGPEQRTSARFDAVMPVHVDGCDGSTHNISAQGVYFETDLQMRVGALVNFSVEYTAQGRTQHLACEARVVRVDRHDGRIGVAMRLVTPLFDDGEVVVLR